jgi:hypothetical protein
MAISDCRCSTRTMVLLRPRTSAEGLFCPCFVLKSDKLLEAGRDQDLVGQAFFADCIQMVVVAV